MVAWAIDSVYVLVGWGGKELLIGLLNIFFEIPDLEKRGWAFGDEAGWFLQDGLAVVVGDQERVCDVKLVLRAGQRDVPETPLFLFTIDLAQRTRTWEFSFGGPDDKYRFPFQSFRLVD